MGNRINTVISSFALALLTRRVLLIAQPEFDWDELFCQPFPGGNWIWPSALPWQLLTDVQSTYRHPTGPLRMQTIMGAFGRLLCHGSC
jgi:xyloglucan fucosyltransferase